MTGHGTAYLVGCKRSRARGLAGLSDLGVHALGLLLFHSCVMGLFLGFVKVHIFGDSSKLLFSESPIIIKFELRLLCASSN